METKKNWMIYVNPTKYNLLGAFREFGAELPWGFMSDGIGKDDTVYFYLTGTEGETKNHHIRPAIFKDAFKRLIFKGRIKEVLDSIDTRDEKYWTDMNHDNEPQKHYALVEITDFIYDCDISSSDLKDFHWGETATLEIDSKTAQIIENKINNKRNGI